MATPAVEPVDVVEGSRRATPDQDNTALILVDAYCDSIRYSRGPGWLVWDGTKWSTDDGAYVWDLVRGLARRLPDTKEWIVYKRQALSAAGVASIVKHASADKRIRCNASDFDARPYELNTPAGIVDLRTGELSPHDRTHMHSKITAVAPDFDMPTPLWDRFLADTFAGDGELVQYLQRLLGVSLVGEVLEQILPLVHGDGANGKSTFLNAVTHLLGTKDDGYATTLPAETLLAGYKQVHPNEIARLHGVRFALTSELEDGERFAEARVKSLTGADDLTGRFLGQEWFDFRPSHTIWLIANHLPDVKAGGPATWRRIRVVPFLHTVPPENRIVDLERKMVETEGPGILAWLIQGAAEYFKNGISEPTSVRLSTAMYERDQDTVARFIAEMCETAPAGTQTYSVSTPELRSAYVSWCAEEGVEAVSAKRFTQDLARIASVTTRRTKAVRYYDGVRLRVDSQTGNDINGFERLL